DAQALLSSVHTVMTGATCYMRKRSGVGYVADVTAQHCKFTFTDGLITTDGIQASGTGSGTCSVRLYGEGLTVSAATAIT
ncbi:MAG TPA: hypothetical protein VLA12_18980, partial [Planctomycetaceae bacterium]|nr:hypothetical protein [Planctomycetaceae bacterium]